MSFCISSSLTHYLAWKVQEANHIHRISAEEAYELSYLEEMWQNEKWGTDTEAVCRREERLAELKEIESFLAE